MKRRQFFAAASVGIAGLAVLPRSAEASHHRVHAAGLLNELSIDVARTLQQWILVREGMPLPARIVSIDNYVRRPLEVTMPALIDESIMILASGTPEDLFAVRRMLNQPHHHQANPIHPDVIASPRSLAELIRRVNDGVRNFLASNDFDVPPEVERSFNQLLYFGTSAWNHLDLAIWHVGDAIFEEFNLDAAFAEAPLIE